jgi:membrane protein implicated in regulation of membrane protease activity
MKYIVGLVTMGLVGVLALIMAGYCLWLTTTSLSYARVDAVENGLLLSLGVFMMALASSAVIIARWLRYRRTESSSKTTSTA